MPNHSNTHELLQELTLARVIADYAEELGVTKRVGRKRECSSHLGAVLADAALQAGVRYTTVVQTRVERILSCYPEAATLPGLLLLLRKHGVAEFLAWNHHVKTARFVSMTQLIAFLDIWDTEELQCWLLRESSRDELLTLHGVGPKTFDYLCCLVGIDSIAVDRHIRTFATEAGVHAHEYRKLKTIVTKAADLLDIRRRDFDAWVWQTVSSRHSAVHQTSLISDRIDAIEIH